MLLDLNLPGKNGWDTFEQMTREIPFTPVIIITAVGVRPEVAEELDLRQAFFKPLDRPKL